MKQRRNGGKRKEADLGRKKSQKAVKILLITLNIKITVIKDNKESSSNEINPDSKCKNHSKQSNRKIITFKPL